jgi:hypothetical protein
MSNATILASRIYVLHRIRFDKATYKGSAVRRNKYGKVNKAGKAKMAFINEKSRYRYV